jgi:cell wall-associated NlpC family hydrolase
MSTRGTLASLLIAAVAGGCGVTAPSSAPAASTTPSPATTTSTSATATTAVPRALPRGTHVWVSVSVATLWVATSSPRAVDAPALAAPVRIRSWLAAMSTSARRGLTGRVETQALYGDPLTVIGSSGTWLHVVAPRQRTHRDTRGYPGWVPRRQVTTHQPLRTTDVATVNRLTAWLRTAAGSRVVEVSVGTRLPVLATGATRVRVATPTGTTLYAARGAVVVRRSAAAALAATASGVVATAKKFLRVPYLWGGRSGFAVDCSGFTGLVYAQHGIRLPRDADDQSWAGRAVASGSVRAGDLTFYGPVSAPTHVAMSVGGTTLIHAPSAGHPVTLVDRSRMATPVRIRRVL